MTEAILESYINNQNALAKQAGNPLRIRSRIFDRPKVDATSELASGIKVEYEGVLQIYAKRGEEEYVKVYECIHHIGTIRGKRKLWVEPLIKTYLFDCCVCHNMVLYNSFQTMIENAARQNIEENTKADTVRG